MDVQAQLQAYVGEVLAANNERREALQAASKAQLALVEEQRQNGILTQELQISHDERANLKAEVQQLQAEVKRLNADGLQLGTQSRAVVVDIRSPSPLALVPRSLRKRVSSDSDDKTFDRTQSKRSRNGSGLDSGVLASFPLTNWQSNMIYGLDRNTPAIDVEPTIKVELSSTETIDSLSTRRSTGPALTPPLFPPPDDPTLETETPPLTIGVYVFKQAGEMTVRRLNTTTVKIPQTVIDAVLEVIDSAHHRDKIRTSYRDTCIRQGAENDLDPITKKTVVGVACKECTLEQQPCVRRSGRTYDVVLAPFAVPFRKSATAGSHAFYISRTKPEKADMACFVKKHDLHGKGADSTD